MPTLAERCMANLDPQHLGGDVATAAIQAALAMWRELPPDGATLATIRPDLDSIGAMAVLELLRQDRGLITGDEGFQCGRGSPITGRFCRRRCRATGRLGGRSCSAPSGGTSSGRGA